MNEINAPLLEEEIPEEAHLINIEESDVVEENNSPEPLTTNFNYGFLLSVFLIYAAADGAWQSIDDLLGNDHFTDELTGLQAIAAWLLRCFLTGSGQAISAWGMNEILAYFNCTDHWQTSELVSSFFTGALWLPFTTFGKLLGGGLSLSGNLDSTARVISTSLSVAAGNASTLAILKHLQSTPKNNKKTPSIISDTVSATAFYLQGPLPEPKFWFLQPSSSGERTLPWTVFFSAAGAVLGEGVNALLNKRITKRT